MTKAERREGVESDPGGIEGGVRDALRRGVQSELLATLLGVGSTARRRLPVIPQAAEDGPDKYAPRALPKIDCEALLPLCRARCCRLTFQLTRQDIADGLRWNSADGFANAKGPDGYCAHHERDGCTVYDRRPLVCRTYDCRQDPRIWIDFERRVPRS